MGLEQTIVAYYILVNNAAKVKKIMLTHLNFNDFLTLHSKIYVTLQLVNNSNKKNMTRFFLKHRGLAMGIATLAMCLCYATDINSAPNSTPNKPTTTATAADSANLMEAATDTVSSLDAEEITPEESGGFHRVLKQKFVEGGASFMSFVAIALVLGLAFCIERIIYLSLSEIDAKKFMKEIDAKIEAGDIEGAKTQCRETRGPVASICYQGLLRIDTSIEDIERSVAAYGTVQAANLEKGCSWITLFIAMAPSLGFLGTVIGMVMAFEQIQLAGDINPTIVAAGMKVALITTIFGIIVALILQLFYNYILSKVDHLTSQMEESAITLLDSILKYKK